MNRIKKISEFLPFFVLGVAVLYSSWFITLHPVSSDSWLRIAIGKYTVVNKYIPNHSDISYKNVSTEFKFVTHSWLGDSLIFMSTSQGFVYGSLLILLPVLITSLFILFKILQMLKIESAVQIITILIALLIVLIFWKLHPLIFATPLLLLNYYLYINWRYNHTRIYYFIPLVFILFANLIGGYIIIPTVLMIGIVLYELVVKVVLKSVRLPHYYPVNSLKSLVIVGIFSVMAIALNPLGYKILLYGPAAFILLKPLNVVANIVGILNITSQSYVKDGPSILLYGVYAVYFLLTIFLFVFIILRSKLRVLKEFIAVLITLPLFILPFFWTRFIPMTVFCTLPIFSVLLNIFIKNIDKKIFHKSFVLLLLVYLFTLEYFWINPIKTLVFKPPQDQIRFIKDNNLQPNVMTSPDLAGFALYSLFPQKALLDLQDDFMDENSSIEVYNIPQSIPKKVFDKIMTDNNIKTLLINKDYASLAINVNQNQKWALVYFDDNGYIFVRKDSISDSDLSKLHLTQIKIEKSLGYNDNEATASAKQLRKFTSKYKSKEALGQLASIYRFMNKIDQAEKTLLEIPTEKWDFTVYTEMGRIKAAQGLCKESEVFLLEAVKLKGEQNFSRAVLDLAVVYAGCLQDKEKATHYFKRYDSYTLPPMEHARTKKIAEDFGINLYVQNQ